MLRKNDATCFYIKGKEVWPDLIAIKNCPGLGVGQEMDNSSNKPVNSGTLNRILNSCVNMKYLYFSFGCDFVLKLVKVIKTVRLSLKQQQNISMKKTLIILVVLLLLGVFCNQFFMQQARSQPVSMDSELDKEIRRVMEKGINLEERKRQVPAIAAAFSRYTAPERARWLAALCYLKTLGTSFMPMDLAEIALAETGGHGLSGKAVSEKGALGVWQLMPHRAKSHGYSPDEMENDEKCADAAVRELSGKMEMAKGNLAKAKKFYCGAGPDADAYEVKRRQFRKEILEELNKEIQNQAEMTRFRDEHHS
jgi:hypothetical protein